jgi:hypothetical protein
MLSPMAPTADSSAVASSAVSSAVRLNGSTSRTASSTANHQRRAWVLSGAWSSS